MTCRLSLMSCCFSATLQLEPDAWSLPEQRGCASVASRDLAVSVSCFLQLVRRTLELSCEAPKFATLRQLQLLVLRRRPDHRTVARVSLMSARMADHTT